MPTRSRESPTSDRTSIASVYGPALLAVAVVGVTLAVLIAIHPVFSGYEPFLPLVVPVMAAAILGGLIPGLTATAAAALAGNLLFLEPLHSLHVTAIDDRVDLGLFVLVGIGISILGGRANRLLVETRMLHQQLLRESERLSQVVATVPGAVCAFQAATRWVGVVSVRESPHRGHLWRNPRGAEGRCLGGLPPDGSGRRGTRAAEH